jgi:hypothetical protein
MKTCIKCNIEQDDTEFDAMVKVLLDLEILVKHVIVVANCKEYKAKNKQKIATYNKQYKSEHKEEVKEYNRQLQS